MEQLTEHFNLEEFVRSRTAAAHGLPNLPNAEQTACLRNLCTQVLEPLRRHLGTPIHINSGFRCPELNRLVGGVPRSLHQTGCAADLHIGSGAEGREWIRWIALNTDFDQAFLERDSAGHLWLHVSCCRRNRRRVLTLQRKS